MKVTKELLNGLITEVKQELKEDFYDDQKDYIVKGEEIMQDIEPMIDEFLTELMKQCGNKINEDYWFASELFATIQRKTKDTLGLS
tara:strand:- start:253 stop:510 length:258 start_codon:yes stop_codon:yes gene_type:complete